MWMWLQLSRGHTEVRSRPQATSCFCQRQTSKPGNRWTWVSRSSLSVSSKFFKVRGFVVGFVFVCVWVCVSWHEVFEELIVCVLRESIQFSLPLFLSLYLWKAICRELTLAIVCCYFFEKHLHVLWGLSFRRTYSCN